MSRRWIWFSVLLVIGLVALASGLAIIDARHVGVFHDDAMYVILGRGLATGEGYRYLNLPGEPIANHFPPGYPALLAFMWTFAPSFPANLAVFKAMNAVFLCASAVLVAQLIRERLGNETIAAGVGVVTAVSVPLLVLVTMVLSESFFLVLVLASLLVAERKVERAGSPYGLFALGLLVGAATLVRSHGIVLLIAIVALFLMRRRWADALRVAAGALVLLVPWQIWSAMHAATLPAPLAGNYGSYVGWWLRGYQATGPSMITATLRRTTMETATMFASLFSPANVLWARALTLAMLAGLIVAGAATLARRAPVTLAFLAGYLAIVFVWPFPPSRFVWGVWPLLLFLLAAGGWWALGSQRPRSMRIVLGAAFAWVAIGYSFYEYRGVRGRWWSSIPRAGERRIAPAVAWARQHTPPGDLIAADDEGAIFLYTGRRTVPVASFTTAHYLSDRSAQVEAAEGLIPLLDQFPIRVVLVGTSRTFSVAQSLTLAPTPRLSLREQFSNGVAFTVLRP